MNSIDEELPDQPDEVRDAVLILNNVVKDRPATSWIDRKAVAPDVFIYVVSDQVLHRLHARIDQQDPVDETFSSSCGQTSRALSSSDSYSFQAVRRVVPNQETRLCDWSFSVADLQPIYVQVIRNDPATRPAGNFALTLAREIDRARTSRRG